MDWRLCLSNALPYGLILVIIGAFQGEWVNSGEGQDNTRDVESKFAPMEDM